MPEMGPPPYYRKLSARARPLRFAGFYTVMLGRLQEQEWGQPSSEPLLRW